MLIRFCASVMIALAGLTFGFYRCENLKSELSVSQQTEEFFRSSAIMIRYRCLDVYELIRNARTSGKYPSLTFLKKLPETYEAGEDFRKAWSQAIAGEAAIPQEERRLLSEFGTIIGASDAEGQQKSLSAFEKETEQLAVMRRETYLKKGKLYRSVGLLFGLMGAILVI